MVLFASIPCPTLHTTPRFSGLRAYRGSTDEELRNRAEHAAQQAQHRAAALEQEALQLEQEVARNRAASGTARDAFKRLANYPVVERGTPRAYAPLCPILRPAILTSAEDVFRCMHCGSIRIPVTF